MKPIERLTDDELLHLAQAAVALRDAPLPFVQAAIALWRAPAAQATPASRPVRPSRHHWAVRSADDGFVPPPTDDGGMQP